MSTLGLLFPVDYFSISATYDRLTTCTARPISIKIIYYNQIDTRLDNHPLYRVWPAKRELSVYDYCVCFLPIYSERQVRWMYQPGSHKRRNVTQDFLSTFLLPCMSLFFSRKGFSRSFPWWTVKSNFVY